MGYFDDIPDATTAPTPAYTQTPVPFADGRTHLIPDVQGAADRLAAEAKPVDYFADIPAGPEPALTPPDLPPSGPTPTPETGGPITSVNGPARENPDELAHLIPNDTLRHAVAAGANIMAGFVPKSLDDVKQMLAPTTYQRFQEDIARSKPEYDAVEATPPFSQERFEHYGNAAAQILMAGAIGKGTLRPKPEMTRADLDAKIAAAQAKYEAKPEPAPTEAIRAKLGQSETRLPVEQELYPSETQAVKQMPSKAPDPESTQAVQTKSGDIPVEQTASDSTQPKIPAADESASGAGAVAAPGEKIAAAAFKLPSGEVVETGALHGNGPGGGEPGFITTFGRFLNREEAGMLATGAKQNLHAEDFYEATDIIPSLVEHPIAEQTPDLRSDYKARNAPEPVVTSTKNAVTGAEREARGLPEAEQAARRDFGTVWDEAAAVTDKDPTAPTRLVDELQNKPRALNDRENALLLRKQIEVQDEHDAAIQNQNENPGNPDAQARLDTARDELQKVYDAGKAAGTETGRGLNARKMLAANDFSLAKMEAETRAVVNQGKPLSEKQAADIAALHERITEAESKVAGYEAQEQFRAELKAAKAQKQPQPEFLRQSYEAAKTRIGNRRGRLYTGVDPTALVDEAIVGAYHISRGVAKFADWSVEMVKEFGETIKPHLQAIFEKARALHSETNRTRGPLTEEQRLAGAKKRTSLQTEIIRSKLEVGDISKTPRRGPIRPDRELLELRGELQRHKDKFNTLLEQGRRANMSFGEKAAETFVRGERAIKLTGIHTLGKLAGAGVTRLVTTPLEQAVGGILNKIPILRQVAEAAPREGFGSFRAEGKALTTGIARGVRNIPKILKGVRTNEEALYGKQNFHYEQGSILDVPGRTHGALKSPIKEAERERGTILRQRHAQRKGIDPTEAATEHEIGQAAQVDAQRAIFMQDNILSDVFRGGIRMLENSKKFPTAGFYLAKTANFLLPIVKIPTNVAIETGVHIGGMLSGSTKLVGVMSRGLKNIKPEEADFIMRHYKKGAIGAALFYTGFMNADKFGGYYVEHDKRKDSDVRWGGARIMGYNIPAWLLHAPAFLVLQAGATFRRVLDKKGDKKAATLATVKGISNDIPFVREMSAIDSMLADGYEGNRERGSLLAGSVVPQGIKDIATMTDKHDAQGNPVRRYPKNELDYLKLSIPGLREDVSLHKAMVKRKLLLQD